MSGPSVPEFHPSSPEAAIERLIRNHNDRIKDCENMVRDYEMEASVLREVNEALANIINPPKPEDPRLTSANTLPVYSQGYSSMQAQSAAHAAQVRADMGLPEPTALPEFERATTFQGRPIKDNPQA